MHLWLRKFKKGDSMSEKKESYDNLKPSRITGERAYDVLVTETEKGMTPKKKADSGVEVCIGCGRKHNRVNERYCSPHCQWN